MSYTNWTGKEIKNIVDQYKQTVSLLPIDVGFCPKKSKSRILLPAINNLTVYYLNKLDQPAMFNGPVERSISILTKACYNVLIE